MRSDCCNAETEIEREPNTAALEGFTLMYTCKACGKACTVHEAKRFSLPASVCCKAPTMTFTTPERSEEVTVCTSCRLKCDTEGTIEVDEIPGVPMGMPFLGAGFEPREAQEPGSVRSTWLEQKIIVMFEVKPLSDKYQQIMFTEAEMRAVNGFIKAVFQRRQAPLKPPPPVPDHAVVIITNPDHDATFEALDDYYDPEEILQRLKDGPKYE